MDAMQSTSKMPWSPCIQTVRCHGHHADRLWYVMNTIDLNSEVSWKQWSQPFRPHESHGVKCLQTMDSNSMSLKPWSRILCYHGYHKWNSDMQWTSRSQTQRYHGYHGVKLRDSMKTWPNFEMLWTPWSKILRSHGLHKVKYSYIEMSWKPGSQTLSFHGHRRGKQLAAVDTIESNSEM